MSLISIIFFQSLDDTQDTNTFKIFQVPIENSKCVKKIKFHNDAPMLKHCQKLLNRCCFSSLVSAFSSGEQTKADNAISLRIEESLKSKMGNCIDIVNTILKNEKKSTRESGFYKKNFRYMMIHKIQIHLNSFKFQ